MARLLRQVGVFTAKISRRRARAALPPTVAVRAVCLEPGGRPDEIGAVLLKTLGLYPPGTYVRLANGEAAVVLGCGPRIDQPRVLSIVRAGGHPLDTPVRRDTADPRFGVKASVDAADGRLLVSPHKGLGYA